MSSARRSAKAEARGASPRESANFIFDIRLTIYESKKAPVRHPLLTVRKS